MRNLLPTFVLLLISLSGTNVSASDTTNLSSSSTALKVCWESELKPPYLMQQDNKLLTGIAVEWLENILNSQNVPFENVVMPWKRCLLSLQRGHVDIVPNSSYKKSRTLFANYSNELYRTHLDFFYLKNTHPKAQQLTKIEQFKSYNIGGVRGFNYSFYEDRLTIDTGASDRETLVRKLKKKRVDFAILQREVLASLYQHKQHELAEIASLPAPDNSFKAFYILTSLEHKQPNTLLSVINKGLKHLQTSGQYQATLNKYLK